MVVFQVEQWRRVGRALFLAAGATESNAVRVTDSLVDSNLAGHDSHGVMRIPEYIRAIEGKQLDPSGQPTVIRETASSSLVDGARTFGQVGAELCMKKAVEQARGQGIAISGLIRAYHIGRLGEYCEMAHEAGVIGMALAGGFGGSGNRVGRSVVPYGGASPSLGTNPIAFGLPAGSQPPVVSDFATSAVAAGKIAMARAKGEQLPPNSLLDREGRPTTNPEDFYNGGMLLTAGAHKGSGLSVAIELLGQALTGGEVLGEESWAQGVYTRAGSVFIAIDPGIFRPAADYTAAADAIIGRIKAVPPATGFDEVLVPGEPEQRSKARRRDEGIGLPESTWQDIQAQAATYGVDLAVLLG